MKKTHKPVPKKTAAKRNVEADHPARRGVPRWVKAAWVVVFSAMVFVGFVFGFIWVYDMPKFNISKLEQVSTPTEVYDRYGHLIFKIQPAGIDPVPLSEIPLNVQKALIATEDANFYQNYGFSIKGYLRAAYYDLLRRQSAQGASTITQQLADVVFLSHAKTIQRKLEQLFLSIQISRQYSKNEILDMYFNHVYFGNGATGISQAAYAYFDLRPNEMKQMTLAQAALIAGLPQAPSLYDPLVNPNLAIQRRNFVLERMYEQRYISYKTMVDTQKLPLQLHAATQNWTGIPSEYAYYRDYLYQELVNLHLSTQLLTEGGVKIYTELDPKLQLSAYNAVNDANNYPAPSKGATEQIQGAAVFVDPHTGGIMALVGGRQDQYTFRGFDYATATQRSPGSAMKPLTVYGPAIQTGQWSAGSALLDGKNNQLSFGSYTVHDWELHPTANGYVTLRWALSESWNSPAVWLLSQIGVQTGIDFAEKAGINLSNPANQNLTIALGNITPGISPLILADAYAAFDNNGIRMPAHAIDRIVNTNGELIYQYVPQPITVMSISTAKQMVGLLLNNVVHGIVSGAAAPGFQVAGKTGSVGYTNYTDSDLWVAAFTPSAVGAIWEGYPITNMQNMLPQGTSYFPPQMFSQIIRNGLTPNGETFGVPVAAGPSFPVVAGTGTTASSPHQPTKNGTNASEGTGATSSGGTAGASGANPSSGGSSTGGTGGSITAAPGGTSSGTAPSGHSSPSTGGTAGANGANPSSSGGSSTGSTGGTGGIGGTGGASPAAPGGGSSGTAPGGNSAPSTEGTVGTSGVTTSSGGSGAGSTGGSSSGTPGGTSSNTAPGGNSASTTGGAANTNGSAGSTGTTGAGNTAGSGASPAP